MFDNWDTEIPALSADQQIEALKRADRIRAGVRPLGNARARRGSDRRRRAHAL